MTNTRTVNDCPTCAQTVPVGFNCEGAQREKGIDPPDPCENPTKGEVSELARLREVEAAAREVLRHEDSFGDYVPGSEDARYYLDSYRAAFEDLRRALHEGDEDGEL